MSFASISRFILRYFILFDAIANGIITLFSLSDFSLLVYRNVTDFCMLILYPATLPNSLISSNSFMRAFLGFPMYTNMSSTNNDSFPFSFPSWIHFLSFSFSSLLRLGLLKFCWIKVMWIDILALFLILAETLLAFTVEYAVSCRFIIYGLYYIEVGSLCAHFLESFYHKWMLNFVKSFFSASIEIIIRFLFYNLLIWYITLIDLWVLKNPCIFGINSTWSWCMILLMYYWIWFASICWGYLCLCSSVTLACNIFFFCIFVWFWYQGDGDLIEWDLLQMFDRICLWNPLVLGLCLLGVFKSQIQF